VSEQRAPERREPSGSPSIEQLARSHHASPIVDAEELVADIWDSDEEIDAFLADLRSSRDASIA
jgi:hypothetical protein